MSKSNGVNSLPIDIRIGTPVVPLSVGHKSNAIVVDVTKTHVTVVTDFGNSVTYTQSEMRSEYGEPEWASEHRLYYGTNEDPKQALKDRFETQIELLSERWKEIE